MVERQCAVENMVTLPDPDFWSRQRVLLTGQTGFKGAWLTLWLERLGASVTGFALAPDTTPSLYNLLAEQLRSVSLVGDIRDPSAVAKAVRQADPTVVIHMAAQPFVRRSFREPVETFTTNALGTAHLLQELRSAAGLRAAVVVTTDKVYRNIDDGRDFVEDDPLGGHDPYSASKAATEIVTASWAASFFTPRGVRIASARAGNVVGGGDWSEDRIVPDIWRSVQKQEAVTLRYPHATRPWQHVLDALCGYLVYVEKLCASKASPNALNFGPLPGDTMTVSQVTDIMLGALGAKHPWKLVDEAQPPEMKLLGLDPSRAIHSLSWEPRLGCRQALEWTADWYRRFDAGASAWELCAGQIGDYTSAHFGTTNTATK